MPRMVRARSAALVVVLVGFAELLAFVLYLRSRDVRRDVPVRGPISPISQAPTERGPQRRVRSAAEQAIIDRYFAEHAVRKIQIGAGPNDFHDWLNTDIEPRPTQVFVDATEPLPFPDHSVRYVYAEQVIEHIPFESGLAFLKECRRVLQPGGRIRIATPNLDRLLALWAPKKTPIQQKFIDFQLPNNHLSDVPRPETALLNLMMHAWGHQFIYDPESLHRTFRAAGFEPHELALGESDDPALRDLEHHWAIQGAGGKDIDAFTSQYVEGIPLP